MKAWEDFVEKKTREAMLKGEYEPPPVVDEFGNYIKTYQEATDEHMAWLRQEVRDAAGDWIAASTIMGKSNPNNPDTLLSATIDIAAVYCTG